MSDASDANKSDKQGDKDDGSEAVVVSKPHATRARPSSEERRVSILDSRKFKALCLAIMVYGVPIVLVFWLCLKNLAKVSDLLDVTKWLGGALAPIFIGYIGSVAYEKGKTL